MSVTRIEGTRPLEAAQTIVKEHPRSAEEAKKSKEPVPAAHADEPAAAPVSNFKPYALSFRFEKDLNRVVVKVIDPVSGELLREIPPEAVIEALKQLRHAPGSVVDEEA